jgi:GWxTD domain-containing protein
MGTAGLWVALVAAAAVSVRAQVGTGSPTEFDRLRADVKAHPDSFPLILALGTALARSATERSDDWRLRLEARKYLEQALRMRGKDPRPLMEIGLLMRKQGMRTDALRVMNLAEGRAERAELELPPRELAEVHFQMALAYETRWEDAEHLGQINSEFTRGSCSGILWPLTALGPRPSSPLANLLAYNFVCPEVFDELMANWQPLDLQEADYASMVSHFREALRLDPTRTDAAFRLLRHLAAGDAWEEYSEVAEELGRRLPDDPAVLLFLGLGYHRTGKSERADSAFTLALERAAPDLRDTLLEPAPLMRTNDSVAFQALSQTKRLTLGDIFWRARDPLFLTPGNERLAEHLARLAYVDVAYGTPQSGIPGRWTDRGSAWLRYGRPLQIRVIRAGEGLLEFWDYGAKAPDLVFQRQRTYRWARDEEMTAEYRRYARDRVPEFYAPEHPRLVAQIPFQSASFRDSTGGSVLEVYGDVPMRALREATDAPLVETGIFVVTGDLWEPRAAARETRARWTPQLDARIPLDPGSYVVSLEALAGDVAAQRRLRVDVPDFRGRLILSDLLVADRFGAGDAAVEDRAALAPVVSRTLVFRQEASIGVLWEIYGLQTDSLGTARYHVRAEVANDTHKNVDVVAPQGGSKSRIEWDASRVPRADGALVEHLTLRLPGSKAGAYRVFVTVTDLLTGQSYTAHRPVAIAND